MIVTVGGSGVGESLLRRVIASYPDAARRVNGLRMIAVAGPRIDPASLGRRPGSRSAPSSPTCTGTWRPATWRSCRAG